MKLVKHQHYPLTMGFVGAVKASLIGWTDFRGRASRAEFWWFQLFLVLANFGVLLVGFFISIPFLEESGSITGISLVVLWVLALVPTTALSVRRLRDGGFAWGLIFIALIPLGGLALLVMYLLPSKARNAEPDASEPRTDASATPADKDEKGPIVASQLERLVALHIDGTISDQQFELVKKKLESPPK